MATKNSKNTKATNTKATKNKPAPKAEPKTSSAWDSVIESSAVYLKEKDEEKRAELKTKVTKNIEAVKLPRFKDVTHMSKQIVTTCLGMLVMVNKGIESLEGISVFKTLAKLGIYYKNDGTLVNEFFSKYSMYMSHVKYGLANNYAGWTENSVRKCKTEHWQAVITAYAEVTKQETSALLNEMKKYVQERKEQKGMKILGAKLSRVKAA